MASSWLTWRINSRAPQPIKLFSYVCGLWLIGLGLYFIFLRPALLPEDLRYMGVTLREIQSAVPGIGDWLRRVFTVMGGFMIGAGSLTIVLTVNALQRRKKLTIAALALAGVSTVGTMSLVNFQLSSDFKWMLLIPALSWLIGLVLCQRQAKRKVHGK